MGAGCDVAVIGGGIVGLATAMAVLDRRPTAQVVVLDKEPDVARHQTGRNSGVIHSGIYYPPGSLKARTCIAGSRSMVEFARAHDIPVEVTGKLIAATRADELPGLERLHRRGIDHGLEVRMLDAAGAREHEPHLAAIAALHVASTGVVDYGAVSRAMADEVRSAGGEVRTGREATGIAPGPDGHWQVRIAAPPGERSGVLGARHVVNCAGLHSDRVAEMAGIHPPARIIPFRGEYYELAPRAAGLVRGLIYPVPDPDFPFLGVHLTRGIDGTVHAGPNAVLALRREGYRWRDIRAGELAATLAYPGFRRLARKHLRAGLAEMRRSAWKPLFVRELQRLVPEITSDDLVRSPAGVRAQAVGPDGQLIDDFLIEESTGSPGGRQGRTLHVLNAPSPAATASIEIGREISGRLLS